MNENTKPSKRTLKFIFWLLFWGGVISAILSPFFSVFFEKNIVPSALALTIIPSVTIVSLSPPQNLSATAVSSSQIDLAWDSVVGALYYNIYRDNDLVASSSVSSYSDTGLSPSTTYIYNVSAVDSSGTESPRSSSAWATTFSVSALPTLPEGGALPLAPPVPEVFKESIVINRGARWTNSREVSLSISAEGAFQMALSNNADFSGAIWEKYTTQKKWVLTLGDGKKTVFAKFRSLSGGVSNIVSDSIILDTLPPANILNLEAIAGDQQILLRWETPPDKDFAGVRIIGSLEFFPTDPFDGILVYQGSAKSFLAVGLINGKRYYYTVFSYDKAGNFSSGAMISAVPFKEEVPPPPPPVFPPVFPGVLPPEIEKLKLSDFDFWQGGQKIIPQEGKVRIKGGISLTISIDYKKAPEVLKTIMITLRKEEKYFPFLLRINREGTRYEAVIIPPKETGILPFSIFILDYKNQTLKEIPGYLEIEALLIPPSEVPWYKRTNIWLVILIGIILIIFLAYLVWRVRFRKLQSSY